jgi:hypothetical protein
VFVNDPAAAPDSLVVIHDVADSIPEYVLGSRARSPTRSVAWSDVREAYRPVLDRLLETRPLNDSLGGRDATICLGTLSPYGTTVRDTAATELLRRRGRHVVPIGDCRPYSGMTRVGAPPPVFTPPPGAPAPVYIEPHLESWADGAVWLRTLVVQHHGVLGHVCEVRRRVSGWAASCTLAGGFIF